MTGRRDLALQPTIDNSGGFDGAILATAQQRTRTITITIDAFEPAAGNSQFRVRAFGEPFPAGSGVIQGRTSYGAMEAYDWIKELRATWTKQVVDLRDGKRWPFQSWDLRETGDEKLLATAGRELAKGGQKLFALLFRQGDDNLKKIHEVVSDAVRSGEQRIQISSTDLFAPWWMLYTSPDPDTDLDRPDAPWSMNGFWGYRHLIEHTTDYVSNFDPRLVAAAGALRIGLNVDPRIDTDGTPPIPYIVPVTKFFDQHGTIETRQCRADVAEAFKSPTFADQIIYFGCHGEVGGDDGSSLADAYLLLSDDQKIRTADFKVWLDGRFFTSNPIVFIGACQGGQMTTRFYTAFGSEFLRARANCVVGPQIDLPIAFAAPYVSALFTALLSGKRLGDAVRDLARECADTMGNPLGLIISLYRGMDTQVLLMAPSP